MMQFSSLLPMYGKASKVLLQKLEKQIPFSGYFNIYEARSQWAIKIFYCSLKILSVFDRKSKLFAHRAKRSISDLNAFIALSIFLLSRHREKHFEVKIFIIRSSRICWLAACWLLLKSIINVNGWNSLGYDEHINAYAMTTASLYSRESGTPPHIHTMEIFAHAQFFHA